MLRKATKHALKCYGLCAASYSGGIGVGIATQDTPAIILAASVAATLMMFCVGIACAMLARGVA